MDKKKIKTNFWAVVAIALMVSVIPIIILEIASALVFAFGSKIVCWVCLAVILMTLVAFFFSFRNDKKESTDNLKMSDISLFLLIVFMTAFCTSSIARQIVLHGEEFAHKLLQLH